MSSIDRRCYAGMEVALRLVRTSGDRVVGPMNRLPFRRHAVAVFAPVLLHLWACASPPETFDPSGYDGQWVLGGDVGPMAMEVRSAGTAEMSGSIVGAVGGADQELVQPLRIGSDSLHQ